MPASDITVYQLISHGSGLPEVTDWFPLPVEYDDGALNGISAVWTKLNYYSHLASSSLTAE